MKKFGVKVYTKDFVTKKEFVKDCVKSVKDNIFDYVELFARPDSYDDLHKVIAEALSGIEVIIHAPHSPYGMDTGDKELFAQNCKLLESSQKFADLLDSKIIILHAGAKEGEEYMAETIRQFNKINDKRLAVENLPYYCSTTQKILHGTSPEQIKRIMAETGCKFCFDICHGVCAANSLRRNAWADLQAYQALTPDMYHLCDNTWDNDCDEHRHYGEGNYDLKKILTDIISDDKPITIETGHEIPVNLDPWLADVRYVRSL